MVEVTFAAAAIGDAEMAHWYRRRRAQLHRHLADYLERLDDLDGHELNVPSDDAANSLLTLMDGLSLQTVLDASPAHRRTQQRQLDSLVATFAGTPESEPTGKPCHSTC